MIRQLPQETPFITHRECMLPLNAASIFIRSIIKSRILFSPMRSLLFVFLSTSAVALAAEFHLGIHTFTVPDEFIIEQVVTPLPAT